jgi:hypothetical protein
MEKGQNSRALGLNLSNPPRLFPSFRPGQPTVVSAAHANSFGYRVGPIAQSPAAHVMLPILPDDMWDRQPNDSGAPFLGPVGHACQLLPLAEPRRRRRHDRNNSSPGFPATAVSIHSTCP